MSEKTSEKSSCSNKSYILSTCPKFIILGAQKSDTTALYTLIAAVAVDSNTETQVDNNEKRNA